MGLVNRVKNKKKIKNVLKNLDFGKFSQQRGGGFGSPFSAPGGGFRSPFSKRKQVGRHPVCNGYSNDELVSKTNNGGNRRSKFSSSSLTVPRGESLNFPFPSRLRVNPYITEENFRVSKIFIWSPCYLLMQVIAEY